MVLVIWYGDAPILLFHNTYTEWIWYWQVKWYLATYMSPTGKTYLLKNSQAVKKGCKRTRVKKVVRYRWQLRNGCDGRSIYNNLTSPIQVNLFCLIPGISSKFIWITVIKCLAIDLPPQQFYNFHTVLFLNGCILFMTWLITLIPQVLQKYY